MVWGKGEHMMVGAQGASLGAFFSRLLGVAQQSLLCLRSFGFERKHRGGEEEEEEMERPHNKHCQRTQQT